MSKVLTTAQADAIYSAMCYLNNVGARLHSRIDQEDGTVLHVTEYEDGKIQVKVGDAIGNPTGGGFEQYASQGEFFDAYGLDFTPATL